MPTTHRFRAARRRCRVRQPMVARQPPIPSGAPHNARPHGGRRGLIPDTAVAASAATAAAVDASAAIAAVAAPSAAAATVSAVAAATVPVVILAAAASAATSGGPRLAASRFAALDASRCRRAPRYAGYEPRGRPPHGQNPHGGVAGRARRAHLARPGEGSPRRVPALSRTVGTRVTNQGSSLPLACLSLLSPKDPQ